MSGDLGADGGEGHGKDIVERSDEGELRHVLVSVGVLLGNGRNEGEAGEEGKLSDLHLYKLSVSYFVRTRVCSDSPGGLEQER